MPESRSPLRSSWSCTFGRNRHDSLTSVDGFRGEHPFASVIVLAEGTGGDSRSAGLATSTIRDVFAEGVAYRVGEALLEAFHEAGEKIISEDLRGCSATAAAFLGDEVWIVHAGSTRALLVGPGEARPLTAEHTLAREMGLSPKDGSYRLRSRDLTLHLGQKDLKPQSVHASLDEGCSVVLLSSGVWHNISEGRARALTSGVEPAAAAEALLRESKARFRRSGGGVCVVNSNAGACRRTGARKLIPPVAGLLLAAAMVLLADRFACPGRPAGGSGEAQPDTGSAWVLPLPPETLVTAAGAGPDLPVAALEFGPGPLLPGPDTLDLFVTAPPDTLFENLARGVYYQDSTVAPLAGLIARTCGFEEPVRLARIIVVREPDVPAFKIWLPAMDSLEASRTAVVVETQSSVAGGAPWIRRLAIYANGNRGRHADPSCYSGAPVEGIPAVRDSSCYSVLVVP
jgi:serine/threonine protein phosphatase PrpC